MALAGFGAPGGGTRGRTRLLMVEGVPGSGKTTTSGKIHEHLQAQGLESRLYQEGDDNPTDLAWVAAFSPEVFCQMVADFPDWAAALQAAARPWRGRVLVHYVGLSRTVGEELPDALREACAAAEPFDGKVPAHEFCDMHVERCRAFAVADCASGLPGADAGISVFESSFMQNQVNELMGFAMQTSAEIVRHLCALAHELEPLEPTIVYLTQSDVARTIGRVAEVRGNWIDRVASWVEATPYGRANSLNGLEGTVEFFRQRKAIELAALAALPCRSVVVLNDDYDADRGVAEVLSRL